MSERFDTDAIAREVADAFPGVTPEEAIAKSRSLKGVGFSEALARMTLWAAGLMLQRKTAK